MAKRSYSCWVPLLYYLFLITGVTLTAGSDELFSNGRTPQFEGWYTRLTDFDQNRSIVVIVATHKLANSTDIGLTSILWSEPDSPTEVWEAFPTESSYTTTWIDLPGPSFSWSAPGYGTVTDEEVSISIPGEIEVDMEIRGRLSFNPLTPEIGPMGFFPQLTPSEILPVHWFVYNLGADADYTVTFPTSGQVLEGSGLIHQESNWGPAFPTAWIWGQAQAENNEAQLVVSGGPVEFFPGEEVAFQVNGWMFGYRAPGISWSFDPTTPGFFFSVETQIDGCAGTLRLSGGDPQRQLNIVASAPAGSFVGLSVPTENGFVIGADESFYATYEVEVIRRGWLWFDDEVLERRQFQNAALEFGGMFRCQQQG